MFKFGRSTRMYILGGPADLMPEEGLTKKQAREVKALEVSPCGAFLPVECPIVEHTEPPPPCKVHHIILGLRSLQALKSLPSWQAKEARKEREAQVAKVQMEAALSKGVSWGMAGDDQVRSLGPTTHSLLPDVPPQQQACSPHLPFRRGLLFHLLL